MKTNNRYNRYILTCCLITLGAGIDFSQSARADHPSASFGGGGTGPINTIPATTLEQGQWAQSIRLEYQDLDRFSDAELRSFGEQDIHADSVDFSIGTFISTAFGVTDDVTVAVRLPHIYQDDIREPHEEDGVIEVENEGDASGLGDILFMSIIRLIGSADDPIQLAAIVGLEIPSGRDSDLTRDGNVFELEHQPGSGSWDPLVGLALSTKLNRFSFHTSGTYFFITDGSQDTNLGDIASYNAALVFRALGEVNGTQPDPHQHHHAHADSLAPHRDGRLQLAAYHPTTEHDHAEHQDTEHDDGHYRYDDQHDHSPTLDFMIEMNGFWQAKHVVGDETDPNSGGHVLFLAPGARLTFGEQWSMFLSAGFPIIQDVNGANHEIDFRLVTGTAFSF